MEGVTVLARHPVGQGHLDEDLVAAAPHAARRARGLRPAGIVPAGDRGGPPRRPHGPARGGFRDGFSDGGRCHRRCRIPGPRPSRGTVLVAPPVHRHPPHPVGLRHADRHPQLHATVAGQHQRLVRRHIQGLGAAGAARRVQHQIQKGRPGEHHRAVHALCQGRIVPGRGDPARAHQFVAPGQFHHRRQQRMAAVVQAQTDGGRRAGRGPGPLRGTSPQRPRRQPRQQLPRDLPAGVAGHLGDLVDLLRQLERRQPPPAGGQHRLHVEPACRWDHVGDRHLAERPVGDTRDGRVRDPGRLDQDPLHLPRVDVLPAPDDQFLEPAGDRHVSVGVLAGQVTGAVPAPGEHPRGLLRLPVVAQHQRRTGHPHLTLGAPLHLLAGARVREPQRHPGQRNTARTGHVRTLWQVRGDRAARLRGAVTVQQRETERGAERIVQGRRARRAHHHAHPQPRHGERTGLRRLHHLVVQGGHAHQERGVLVRRPAQHLVGVRTVREADRGTDGHGTQHAHVVRHRVEERHRPQDAIPRGQAQQRRVAGGGRPQRRPLRAHHSPGAPGRPRRVEQPGRLVEAQVVAGRMAQRPRRRQLLPARQHRIGPLGEAGRLRETRLTVLADEDHHGAGPVREHPAHLGQLRGAGDDQLRRAVLQQMGQFRVGRPRIERHPDGGGPGDGEVTLHRLHPVRQVDHRRRAAREPQLHEMAGHPGGTPVQLGPGHRPTGVLEGDPVGLPRRVPGEQFVHRADQLRPERGLRGHDLSSGAGRSVAAHRQCPAHHRDQQ